MHPNLINLEEQVKEDFFIGSLDPLNADQSLQLVPLLNKQKDTNTLIQTLISIMPAGIQAAKFDFSQACAAMRDIGIFLGSLKRHGTEPVAVVPELENVLNLLANITYLPPRDTLIHYVRWNPEGSRQRTYTGTEDEQQLIQSVKVANHPLLQAIMLLNDLYDIPLHASEFVATCNQVTENFEGMVQGIVNAKRNVSPKYFADELRFYFDPIILNNTEYLGPGAVEMPVFIFDHILWNCDLHDEIYIKFKEDYIPYNQPIIRDLYYKFLDNISLTTRVINTLTSGSNISETELQGAHALIKLFNTLKSFRAPHKKLADQAYEHAEKAEYRSKGSGGYEPEILHYILNHNIQAQERLKSAVQTCKENFFVSKDSSS